MTISENSQLGLRFISDKETKVRCLNLIQKHHAEKIDKLNEEIKVLESYSEDEDCLASEYVIPDGLTSENIGDVDFGQIDEMFCFGEKWKGDTKYFLVQGTVWKAAELIKIGENFTGRTLKDIKLGGYMYLLGKHQMLRFLVVDDGIKGIYFDDKAEVFFEWGIRMDSGKSFCYTGFNKEFSMIMQLLTFIELGDIEVKVINSLQTNGAKVKADKIYNGTRNTVYVVDSSWNQLLIRADGFVVRGHFRLQPCGVGMVDRKLIWINAYEKDGYVRQPKANIIK